MSKDIFQYPVKTAEFLLKNGYIDTSGQRSQQGAGTGYLVEVGTGDGAEYHLARHLEVEPQEDQVLYSSGLRCPP